MNILRLAVIVLFWSHADVDYAADCAASAISVPIIMKPHVSTFGQSVRAFSAQRRTATAWEPVVIEVDEINARGDYVLSGGLPYTKNTDDGLLDANDELVFLGRDLGCDFTIAEAGPRVPAGGRAWKIAVTAGSATGYLLVIAGSPPLQTRRQGAAAFDTLHMEVVSPFYRYAFNKANPVLLGKASLINEGKEYPVVAGAAFRWAFRLPWWLIDFTLADTAFASTIESWQEGPVRTIIAVGAKFKKFLALFDFHMFSELIFYDDYFQIPTVVEFPRSPRDYLKPGSGLAYTIFLNGDPTIVTNLPPMPLAPDGLVAAASKAEAPYLTTLQGAWGEMAIRVNLGGDESAAKLLPFQIRKEMMEGSAWSAEWDWLKSLTGDTGVFVDMSRVTKGSYQFGLDLMLNSKANHGLHEAFVSPMYQWVPLPMR